MRRLWMLFVALAALVIFMAVPALAAEGETLSYCLCGSNSDNPEDHTFYMDGETLVGCDGTKLDWKPWSSTSSLPTSTGNWYLTAPVTLPSTASQQAPAAADTHIVLDLNGYTVNVANNKSIRIYALNKDNCSLTITDTAGSGKMIRSNSYSGEGGIVWLSNSTQTFVLMGGEMTIASGTADGTITGRGGLVSINGKFYMLGGNLHHGKTTTDGGNVAISTTGTMHMSGGTISDGTSNYGGNLCIQKTGTATLSGGEITNGTSDNGGNLYITSGTLTLSGVNVSGGQKKDSTPSNIATGAATLHFTGGTVEGWVDVSAAASINISGNPVINTAGATNLNIGSKTMAVGTMTEGANISLTISDVPHALSSATVTAGSEAYFHSDSADYGVALNNNDSKLWVGPVRCLCAGAGENGACVGEAGGCTESSLVWLPWTSESTLPAKTGNWYLTNTVTMTAQVRNQTTNQIINIDLNGQTVQNKSGSNLRMYWLNASGIRLTVTDGVGTGKMINTSVYDQGAFFWLGTGNTRVTLLAGDLNASGFSTRGQSDVGGVAVDLAGANTVFTMYGGKITAGAGVRGLVVSLDATNTTFNMHGGEIVGGVATFQKRTSSNTDYYGGGQGGAVYVNGTFNMYGGKISGGQAVFASLNDGANEGGGQGDNVYLTENGKLNMYGGEIVGGVDATNAATITISGAAKINRGDATNTTYNLLLGDKTVAVGTMAEGADICFTATGAPRVFSSVAVTAGSEAYFHSDTAGYGAGYNGNDGKLWLGITYCLCGVDSENPDDHKHYMDGQTLIGCDGSDLVWFPWTSGTALPAKTGQYYLTKNVSLSGQTSLTANSNVVLDLNGYKVTPAQTDGVDISMRMISIHNSGAKFTLTDTYVVPENNTDESRPGGEIVTSTTKKDVGNGVWLRNDKFAIPTTFVMVGGKLTGADATNTNNGTVVNAGASCKFYMLGGTITGGKTSGNGGNVYLSTDSSMVMTGGTISSGVAARGANVYTNNGCSFIMTGGTITGGNASGNGGNLYIGGGTTGTLDISGSAIISEGTTSGNGGNIFLNSNAEATMISGTVTGGNAKNGGNINISVGATLTMEGGEVTDGTATTTFCSGVQVFGSLDVSGGKIEDSIQVINWNVLSGASLTISGAAELEQIKLSKGTDKSDMNKDDIEIPVITIDGTLDTSVTEGDTTRDLAPINVLTYGDDDAYISGTTVAANSARFVSDYADEGRDVHFIEGENKLYIGKYSCLCGANCSGATAGCDGIKVIWTPWSSASNNKLMPAATGNYYLTDSFTASSQTNPAPGAQIRLDLNGQTITRYNYRLYALNAAADANGNYIHLQITDNSQAGNGILKSTRTAEGSYDGQGTVLWACNGNDITLLRGTVDASGMNTTNRGGAVSADNGSTFFKMYGGTVIGGTAGIGGTIGSDGGNVEIYGGTVDGGTATSGGTIYSTGNLTINSGVIINGGTATDGGTIYSTGTATINNGATINGGEATNGGTIYSTGDVTVNGATINGGNATKGGTVYTSGTFTLEGGTVTGGEAEEGGNFYIAGGGDVTLNSGTVSLGKAIRYESTGGSGGNFYILGALTIDGATVSDGKAGTLDTDGTTVLYTTAGWGGNMYLGRSTDKAHAGSLELISGTIEKGNAKGNGGSIYIYPDASMTMSGGTVKEGKSHADQGGNIFCSGSLSITGGTVEDGNAKNGGNIGINTTETVTISGGTIQNGTATTNGGNIRVNSSNATCTLTISGNVQILDGTATGAGGNISVERNNSSNTVVETATLNIQGGTISGGSAVNGGNINIGTDTALNMTAGTVTGGTALRTGTSGGTGGNIYILSTVSISGGIVSDGTAGAAATGTAAAVSGWGGNIELNNSAAQLTVSGTAQITGGWANNNGGSIRINNGTMIMEGGSVTGGTTADRGGNIFLSQGVSLTVTGGTISGGTAGNGKGGGNISANAGASTEAPTRISLSNVTISGGNVNKDNQYRANLEISANSVLTLGNGVNIDGGVGLVGADTTVNLSGTVNVTGLSLKENLLTLNGLSADSKVEFTCSDKAEGRIVTNALSNADILSASTALASTDGYRLAVNADNKLYLTQVPVEEMPGVSLNGGDIVLPLETALSIVSGTDNWLQLTSGHDGNLNITDDLKLDLNGNTINGTITVAEGKTLYIADESNADYTDEGGRIVGKIEGNVAQEFLTGGWEDYGHNYRFVVLTDVTDGVTSYHAHRIYLAVKSIVLYPNTSAINFRTVLKCDDTFKGYITAYGATAKSVVDGEEKTSSCQYDLNEKALVGGGNENLRVTRLSNILTEENEAKWAQRSEIGVSCQGTLTLTDASGSFPIPSAFKGGKSFKDLVLEADKLTSYNEAQQNALVGMYARHQDLMKDWGLTKIPTLSAIDIEHHCLCGDPFETTGICAKEGHKPVIWHEWTDALAVEQHGEGATAATKLPSVSGNYYLTGDVRLSAQAGIPENTLICIDLHGQTIESVGRVALVKTGATLHLTNTKDGGQVVGSGHNSGTGRNGATILSSGDLCIHKNVTVTTNNINGISNGGVIESSGNVYIYGGTVQAPALTTVEDVQNTVNGSAIYITAGNLYISGGTINGTEVTGNGGAIYIKKGNAEISGTAQINGSAAALGGTVYMEAGTLTVSGGTLNCGDAIKGANIYVAAGQFDMTGGTLQGATFQPKLSGQTYASYEGVNLYLKGQFNMSGGQIKDANVPGNGANIFIHSAGSATVSGGSISGGKARRYIAATGSENKSDSGTQQGGNAGNIYLQGSLTLQDGASITDGMAGFMNLKEDNSYEIVGNGYGGNILLNGSAAELIIEGGTVSGGKAWGNGGNIRVDGGSVTMSDGTVTLGQSINDRGGNFWIGSATLEISGGTVSSGRSKSLGGNIHSNNGGILKLLGGTISGGSANSSTGHKAANVSVLGANTQFTLGSATIDGGICINPSSATEGTGFAKLTGNPQVAGTGIDIQNDNANATFGPLFTFEDLADTASVKIRNTSTYEKLVDRGELDDAAWLAYEKYTNNFVAHNASYDITFEEDGIYMRKLEEGTRYSCECGANRGTEAHVDGCNGYDFLWNEWNISDHKNYLPTEPGHWYLTGTLTGTGEDAYFKGAMQTTLANDYYLDSEGNYKPIYSVLALNTAGNTMTNADGTHVPVSAYTTPVYADEVGATTVTIAYVDPDTKATYTLAEAASAGINPVDSYEISIDLNGMKIESAHTSRILSFRGAQTITAKQGDLALSGWRQADVTMNIIDSSKGHTGCLSTYGVYTKGENGEQLYRSSGTQHQGSFIWMPNDNNDTLNTYYINMNASTVVAGAGTIETSGTMNLWHTTYTAGTSQGYRVSSTTPNGVSSSIYGGGAMNLLNDANVTMHGGIIQGGTAIYRYITGTNTRSYDRAMGGGNVFIASGTFTLDGGTIKGGRSLLYQEGGALSMNNELKYYSYGSGGGVYVFGGELILKGNAQITENYSGIVTGTVVTAENTSVNLFDYVDVASLNVVGSLATDNVYLGGNTLKAENFTGSVGYNTGRHIQLSTDYAGTLVSRSGNCTGTLTRETTSGKSVAGTGNSATYLVGYGIADIHPTPADLTAGVVMTNFGNDRDTSTLYNGSQYDLVNDPNNYLGTWDTKLYATALATTDGEGDTVIVLSLDCSSFNTSTANQVKRLVSAATGVPMDNISLSSAHQHSAPPAKKIYVTNEDGTETLKTNYEYTYYKGIVEAAVTAMNDRKQATVSVGTLDTTAEGKQYNFVRNVKILSNGNHVGMYTDNHQTHYLSNNNWYASIVKIAGNYVTSWSTPISNPSLEYETEVDTTMQIVRYVQEGGTDIIMTNFQTHPHLGSNSESCYVHSDVVGAFRNYLAEATNARVMYFSGGGGNVNPTSKISADKTLYSYASSTLKFSDDLIKKLEQCDIYGQTLATMAANFLSGTDYSTYNGQAKKSVPMAVLIDGNTGSKDVKASVREVTYNRNTSTASERAISKLIEQTNVLGDTQRSLIDWSTGTGDYASFGSDATWGTYVGYSTNKDDRIFSIFHARNVHEMLMWQEAGLTTNTITLTAYALGDLGFVAAPYEMFHENGSDIKNGTANSVNATAYSGTLTNSFAMTIIATQANGANGYIPSSLAFDNGGYSTDTSNFAKGTGELLVTNFIDMLNNLK